MIILDSNVVSALMRLDREPLVAAWLNKQRPLELFITTVTIFEVQFGLELMPRGKGRTRNEARFSDILDLLVPGRVLNLDQPGAALAATIHLRRGQRKTNVETPDSLIAGIALHLGAAVATRNTKDFKSLRVPLINPWTA